MGERKRFGVVYLVNVHGPPARNGLVYLNWNAREFGRGYFPLSIYCAVLHTGLNQTCLPSETYFYWGIVGSAQGPKWGASPGQTIESNTLAVMLPCRLSMVCWTSLHAVAQLLNSIIVRLGSPNLLVVVMSKEFESSSFMAGLHPDLGAVSMHC